MPVFDKLNLASDLRHRYWQIDPATGLVLPGFALFDEFGDAIDRTNPLPVEQLNKATFAGGRFVDPNGSSEMAKDHRFQGAETHVHNGLENVYWLGTNLTGSSVTFDSATRGFGGSAQSILLSAMSVGDVFELVPAAPVDLSDRESLSIQVWVVGGYTVGDIIQLYAVDGAGVQIGSRVNLADRIEESETGRWQSAVFSTLEMGLSTATISGLRVEQGAKVQASPTLNLDDIIWHETGGISIYTASAPPGDRLRIASIILTLSSVYTTVATNNGSSGIAPIGWMAVPTLPVGISLAQEVDGVLGIQAIWHDLRDAGAFGCMPNPVPALTDGTTTTLYIVCGLPVPFIVEGDAATNNMQFQFGDDTRLWTTAGAVYLGTREPIE